MIVVVGGHSRNTGKTSVICGLIRALPEARWTAIKLSPHAHRAPDDQDQADTNRYVGAGASRSVFVSGPPESAAATLAEALAGGGNALIESNSVVDLLHPDLYLFVVNAAEPFKETARQYVRRADAFVVVESSSAPDEARPCFHVDPPGFTSEALIQFVRERMVVRPAETRSPE